MVSQASMSCCMSFLSGKPEWVGAADCFCVLAGAKTSVARASQATPSRALRAIGQILPRYVSDPADNGATPSAGQRKTLTIYTIKQNWDSGGESPDPGPAVGNGRTSTRGRQEEESCAQNKTPQTRLSRGTSVDQPSPKCCS